MLRSENRLKSARTIAALFRKGGSAQNDLFLVRFSSARTRCFRAVVVTSAKLDKRAVVRNRIRRRLTEALRIEMSHLVPVEIAITPKSLALDLDFGTLRTELFAFLSRLRLFR